jgi:putrescine aminotransferase
MIVESELAGTAEVTGIGEDVEAHVNGVIEKYRQYVNPGLTRLLQFGGFGDLEESADGCVVTMATGATYLDFLGGYGVFSVGHRHPKVVAAVHRQLDRMPLSTRAFFHEPQALLSEKLASIAPGGLRCTFYSNSGAEAVEAALKIARIATGRAEIVSTEGSFHGKTIGALSVTGREKYRKPFEPLLPGVRFVPFNDLAAAEAAITEQTAAFIVEPIQGEGGIIPAAPGYLAGLRRLCTEQGALLIADEVQTGLGRTGSMFGVDEAGVVPDVMTLAKALGGGVMPIGATIASPEIWERLFGENPLLHTSTFGGNQLACVAALAAIEVIEEENLSQCAVERGAQLLDGLRAVQRAVPVALSDVRGRGLMIGVEFGIQDVAELTINGMTRRGVIAGYTLNNPRVIRFEPPLIVTAEQIDTAVTAFQASVVEALELLEGVEY